MILEFSGPVILGDASRCTDEGLHGLIWIGNRDVLNEIDGNNFTNPVTVGLADSRYAGDLAYGLGWGYSEYTPVESDQLTIGPHNLLEILERYEGQAITLWIADEPFNTLETLEAPKEPTPPTPRGKRALTVSPLAPNGLEYRRGKK